MTDLLWLPQVLDNEAATGAPHSDRLQHETWGSTCLRNHLWTGDHIFLPWFFWLNSQAFLVMAKPSRMESSYHFDITLNRSLGPLARCWSSLGEEPKQFLWVRVDKRGSSCRMVTRWEDRMMTMGEEDNNDEWWWQQVWHGVQKVPLAPSGPERKLLHGDMMKRWRWWLVQKYLKECKQARMGPLVKREWWRQWWWGKPLWHEAETVLIIFKAGSSND